MAATIETIAAHLGVSKATVSLALRGSRRISEAMRGKVAKAAAELGYAPNPLVRALMVSLRGRRGSARTSSLGFLTAHPERDGWRRFAVFRQYFEGARARAEALGFGLEEHWAGDTREAPNRLTRILEARGIPGVILAPLPVATPPLDLDWSRFAVVALGHTFKQVPAHRVTNNQLHTVTGALEACRDQGYRRIGFAASRNSNERVDHIWLAGYLAFQARIPGLGPLPPLISDHFDEETLMSWYRDHRPDVIVSPDVAVLEWLRRRDLSVPGDVAFVHLDWTPERGNLAAMNQNPSHIGQAAAEVLVELINQNQRGAPTIPRTVLIESTWRPGPTLPPAPGLAPAPAPERRIPKVNDEAKQPAEATRRARTRETGDGVRGVF